jgi:hypothetical protein
MEGSEKIVEKTVTERLIKNTLKKLSKQRVAMILQPGNVWVIEKPVGSENERVAAALSTCYMRGWVDILQNAVPTGKIQGTGDNIRLPDSYSGIAPIYRLTEAGWDVINSSHNWVIITFFIAFATLLATILSILLNWRN